jgi:SAM-dependent methyltransferase
VKTTVVPDRMLELLKRHRRLYQWAHAGRIWIGGVIPARHLPGLPGRIHFNDFMLTNASPEGVARYRASAMNVIANIEDTLAVTGRSFRDVGSWLDFGCGYGRVVRFLIQEIGDQAQVYVADVNDEAVAFCANEFGVIPISSRDALKDFDAGSFDFVYAISVITHLSVENARAFLRLMHTTLNPGGIAMFTTHGAWSLRHAGTYGRTYERMTADLERRIERDGIAFVPYHHYRGETCGMTWQSADWIRKSMHELHGDSMRLLLFKPSGLYGHQDVFAYERQR